MYKEYLKEFNHKIAELETKIINNHETVKINMHNFFDNKPKFIIFMSISNAVSRARVFTGTGNTIETGWKSVVDKCRKFIKENNYDVCWVKADIVNEIKEYSLEGFLNYSSNIRRYYMRDGISFDKFFNLAFLEQEVNANSFIKRDDDSSMDQLNLSNINFYMKTYKGIKYKLNLTEINKVYLFTTIGYIHDYECHELHRDGLNTGRRIVNQLDKNLVYNLIDSASIFLASQVDDVGRFVYGYFPCFDKKIEWYNTLRHASTIYSMIEAYDLTKNEILADSIKRAIKYLIKDSIVIIQDIRGRYEGYVIEKNSDNEIKLGANAHAILALSKYTTVFKDNQYLEIMKILANGIQRFQDKNTGEFVHILNFPDLSIKERHRIIYYDGEAAFALMRLYELDRDSLWLETVEKAFEYFIEKDYWKYHDHWLSYCVNELTKHKPSKQYYEFGLKNVEGKLDFILGRDTTYPTFLELLMATFSMIKGIESSESFSLLLEGFDKDKVLKAIEHRANHQLNGFFFPEIAMYFKAPLTISGAFYIRHHSFRTRIDDIEHNISGYYNYYKNFLMDSFPDDSLPVKSAPLNIHDNDLLKVVQE